MGEGSGARIFAGCGNNAVSRRLTDSFRESVAVAQFAESVRYAEPNHCHHNGRHHPGGRENHSRSIEVRRCPRTTLRGRGVVCGSGWPKPGWPGASILAGHINSAALGLDTFAKIIDARPGDRIEVRYDSGDQVSFTVTKSAAESKVDVPGDKSIWDAGNPRPLLRLITCDPGTPLQGGHYEGNWVVWADLASAN